MDLPSQRNKRLKVTLKTQLAGLKRRQNDLRAQCAQTGRRQNDLRAQCAAMYPVFARQSFELDLSPEQCANPSFIEVNQSFGFPISCDFPSLWVYGNSHMCTPFAIVKMPASDREVLKNQLPAPLWQALSERSKQHQLTTSFWVVIHEAPQPYPCQNLIHELRGEESMNEGTLLSLHAWMFNCVCCTHSQPTVPCCDTRATGD
jgi:hypothetical protein